MLGGGPFQKKKECKSLRNFSRGTLRLRIWISLGCICESCCQIVSFNISDSVFNIGTCQLQTRQWMSCELQLHL